MEFRDYYKTLGVAKTASAKEIKQAFRRLARKHHPDVNPGDKSAEATFKELNEAYEVLGNPETRKKYDELGANWRQYEQAGPGAAAGWGAPGGGAASYRTMTPEEMEELFGGGGSPFSDFFHTFFGGQADGTRSRSGPRAGRGGPRRSSTTSRSIWRPPWAAGWSGLRCPAKRRARFEVRIPAGVSDGTRLTAGDLHLRVRLKPHPRFERQGRDLTTQAMVSMSTAVLGGTVDVVTLSGSRLTLKVPAGTQPGQRLRVKGHGLPAPGAPDDRGDLYVAVAVRTPTTLTDEERAHYEALRRLKSQDRED